MQGRRFIDCMIYAGKGGGEGVCGGWAGTGWQRLTCGAATHEGPPPPSVVLDCQLEVGEGNGDESRDNDKDDEDN